MQDIRFNGTAITFASTLDEVARYDNAVFGIMHEMRQFAAGNYVTGAYMTTAAANGTGTRRLFANFRMYYALCRTGYSVYLNNTVYTGAQISDMYRKSYRRNAGPGGLPPPTATGLCTC